MQIDLSEQQEQQLREGQTVEIEIAEDQPPVVLLGRDQYERVRHLLEEPETADEIQSKIDPMMRRSMEAFWRELPELLKLKSRKRQWAAYHGDERVCVVANDVDAYDECNRRGLLDGEYYVGYIELDPEGIPPWGTLQGERSLFEYTEIDSPMPHDGLK